MRPNGIKDGRSGGISTMSLAITFNASSNSSSMIWGSHNHDDNGGNGKSRVRGMKNKFSGGRKLTTIKEKSSSHLGLACYS